MPHPKSDSAFEAWAEQAWSDVLGRTVDAGAETIELFHERGMTDEDQAIEQTFTFVEPPKSVIVRSYVKGTSAARLRSPTYLATVRRRLAMKIRRQVIDLQTHTDDDSGFATWTHEVLEELRRAIQELSNAEEYAAAEHEGNSCEILRQIRDSFLNNGWMRYCESTVREAAVKILTRLATADEITGEDANRAFGQLMERGLNPAVGFPLSHVEEEDEVPD